MRITAHHIAETESALADFLTIKSGLSKMKIKDCMAKGGVWVQRRGKREERCRKATTKLTPGDRVGLYFDQDILNCKPAVPNLIADHEEYSVWEKPAGVLSQGTRFGDHCSLLRLAQQSFTPPRLSFPVHRLDREASGLVLIAHTAKAARALSLLWQNRQVEKEYEVTVKGILVQRDLGTIALPLDGKEARTDYQVIACDLHEENSLLRVSLLTGRLHQIRRHCAMAGFPVIGDPKYGTNNKNTAGLALRAIRIAFDCPWGGGRREFRLSSPALAPSLP